MKKIILATTVVTSLFSASISFNEADENAKRINPEFSKNIILSYNSSINEAKKSVINISTKKKIKNRPNPMDEFFNDPFFRDFFGFGFGMPQQEREVNSLGSGVIISDNGYIITNNHVVDGADEVIVTMPNDDKEYKAKIVGMDSKTDLAIIKVDEKNLPAIKFANSNELLEGDIVFAIGNPFGMNGTVTQGIISALNKNNIGINQYENFIQTDASINPGNSGGALVDSRGALIGINSAILSRSGGNNGIGFAIPSNMVKDIAQRLISDGKIERGYLGVTIINLTNEHKEIYKNQTGALIAKVDKGGAADKAGLKRGDLIIKVDDKIIKNSNDLKNTIGSLSPNKTVEVEFEREKSIKTTKIKLDSMPQDNLNNNNDKENTNNEAIDGLSLSNITDEIRQKFKLDSDTIGVLVTNVKEGSKAEQIGFKGYDIIIQVGKNEIKNIEDFNKNVKEYKGRKTLIWVLRNKIPLGLAMK